MTLASGIVSNLGYDLLKVSLQARLGRIRKISFLSRLRRPQKTTQDATELLYYAASLAVVEHCRHLHLPPPEFARLYGREIAEEDYNGVPSRKVTVRLRGDPSFLACVWIPSAHIKDLGIDVLIRRAVESDR